MRDVFNRNDNLFFIINIALPAITFIVYSLNDNVGFALVFFLVLLVNIVASLWVFKVIREVKKSFVNISKIVLSVALNLYTYLFLLLFIIRLF